MATIIELEVDRVFTAGLLGEDSSIQTQLTTRADEGWTLVSTLNIKSSIEALLFYQRLTQGPP